ncbi:conjugal transfer protein TraH [Enterovibrio paralichthyis]|uniref:conjugal transfer protein TraH n=1 Tax=Enterovibrio paralichthyis TaxID=2853805 RepID=UPI001C4661AA|nr:conjugal transfer protein TraH [Enterovibrio paralichthyis]MBV7300282.1 conjugal transfer protein TraH [Enterovibrio paralichthyis]
MTKVNPNRNHTAFLEYMRKAIVVISSAVLISTLTLIPVANADIKSDMSDFFSGTMNTTDPNVSYSQMGGNFSGGSAYMRTPVRNVTPFQVSLPSFSGGCNGIDAFMGAFSFISSEQLVALGKAIASNAPGFAFDLAVGTLSPLIAEQYQKLREVANMINQFQINSCEQAAAVVANIWPNEGNKNVQRSVCQTLGQKRGFFTDSAAAKYECDNMGKAPSIAGQAAAENEFADVLTMNQNLVWTALSSSNVFNDIKMRRMVMTLTGTIINKTPTGANESPWIEMISPQGINDNWLSTFLRGGDLKIHSCDTGQGCLNVNQLADKITISEEESFKGQVEKMITEMRQIAASKDEELRPEHIKFLNSITVPIYKMILVDTAYSRGATTSALNPEAYAEVVAIDYLHSYVTGLINATQQAVTQRYSATTLPQVETWRNELNTLRTFITQMQSKTKDNVSKHVEMMDRTMQLERMLAGQLTNQVTSAFQFTRSL